MSAYKTAPQGKDPELWEQAQKRVSFKRHLTTYIIVNLFLWILWFLTDRDYDGGYFPWPVWPTVGWGIGLAFNYIGVYVIPGSQSVEKEYQKLSDKNNKQ